MFKQPTSFVPAVLTAYYQWFLENEFEKIHILVYVDSQTPQVFKDMADPQGMITYNIGKLACRNLVIDAEGIRFSIRRQGVPYDIHVKCEDLYGIEIPLNEQVKTIVNINDHANIWKRVPPARPADYVVEIPEPVKAGRPSLTVVK
jgi:stringent starvation protein B